MGGLNSKQIADIKKGKTDVLVISNQRREHIQKKLYSLSTTKTWDLSNNFLCSISHRISALSPSLTSLSLSSNDFDQFPIALCSLSSLTSLDLSYNFITSIPSEVQYLTSLSSLNLSFNRITDVNPDIGNLSSLQILKVSNNFIEKIPDNLSHLRSIKLMSFSHNKISTFPKILWSTLEEFHISSNSIHAIPYPFIIQPSLRILFISHNKLTSFPPHNSGNNPPSNLKEIYINNNLITELTSNIYFFPKLEMLDLKANMLKELPFELFVHSPLLQYLDISYNMGCKWGMHMPNAFAQAPTVREIHISKSQREEIDKAHMDGMNSDSETENEPAHRRAKRTSPPSPLSSPSTSLSSPSASASASPSTSPSASPSASPSSPSPISPSQSSPSPSDADPSLAPAPALPSHILNDFPAPPSPQLASPSLPAPPSPQVASPDLSLPPPPSPPTPHIQKEVSYTASSSSTTTTLTPRTTTTTITSADVSEAIVETPVLSSSLHEPHGKHKKKKKITFKSVKRYTHNKKRLRVVEHDHSIWEPAVFSHAGHLAELAVWSGAPGVNVKEEIAKELLQLTRIRPGLFLSSRYAAQDREKLHANNITHILVVGVELIPAFPTEFEYYMLSVRDNAIVDDLSLHFPICQKFIDTGRKKGGVLVHCAAGSSRSASCIMAYLMWSEGISFSQARKELKLLRPIVKTNFYLQLEFYEGFLKTQTKRNKKQTTQTPKLNLRPRIIRATSLPTIDALHSFKLQSSSLDDSPPTTPASPPNVAKLNLTKLNLNGLKEESPRQAIFSPRGTISDKGDGISPRDHPKNPVNQARGLQRASRSLYSDLRVELASEPSERINSPRGTTTPRVTIQTTTTETLVSSEEQTSVEEVTVSVETNENEVEMEEEIGEGVPDSVIRQASDFEQRSEIHQLMRVHSLQDLMEGDTTQRRLTKSGSSKYLKNSKIGLLESLDNNKAEAEEEGEGEGEGEGDGEGEREETEKIASDS